MKPIQKPRPRNRSSLIERQSDVPMYAQIADILRTEHARCRPGARFPGDRELCARFKVSQPVVRAALDRLVKERLLRRIAGKGTFSTKPSAHPISRKPCLLAAAPLGAFFPHSDALQGIQEVAAEHGYNVLLHSSPSVLFDPTAFVSVANDWLEQAEGLIWVAPHLEECARALPNPRPAEARVVLVNLTLVADGAYTSVLADYSTAAFNLVSHLIEQGRRRIGYIGGPRDRRFAQLRWEGYQRAIQRHGLEIEPSITCPFAEDALGRTEPTVSKGGLDQQADTAYQQAMHSVGREGMRRILMANPHPDAVFAVTDVIALGALAVLQEAGLRVPDEVALTGFDDSPLAQQVIPGLTTARLPYLELGRLAARLLFDQLNRTQLPGSRHLIPCPLVIRDSSGRRPGQSPTGLLHKRQT